MPSSQSTILQHFSPRRAGESSMVRDNRRQETIRAESTDSEGSAGVAAIPLSSNRDSPGLAPLSARRRRRIEKVASSPDDEIEEAEVQIIPDPKRRRREERPESPSRTFDGPRRSGRTRQKPPPLDLVKGPKRKSLLYIELPSLSAHQKSLYSATLSTADQRSPARKGKGRQTETVAQRKLSPTSDGIKTGSDESDANGRMSRILEKVVPRRKAQSTSSDKPKRRLSDSEMRKAGTRPLRSHLKKPRRKVRDPDESDAETENEDLAKELEMDEPERFKSHSRLRKKKETSVQRNIRKLKERRDGVVHTTSEESEQETWGYETVSDSEEGFIVDDGGRVEEGLLPHQFSNNSAQTPEFKFKVVFHYLVLLVIKGSRLLPLKGDLAEYFKPQLRDLRRKMEGYRDGRVRSQIWKPRFVKALQTFPVFRTVHLEVAELGCDACNVGTKRSTFRTYLEGGRYNKETHEIEDSDSDSEASSSAEDLPREFLMGKHCKRRSEVFHSMSHWENQLFQRIRGYYNDLLRARNKPVPEDSEASSSDESLDSDADERKAERAIRRHLTAERVAKLRRGNLPPDVYNENQVLEWMDRRGYQAADYRRLDDLMEQSRMLEHDKSKDD